MDSAIDLSNAEEALDLSNIRFQLMYVPRQMSAMMGLKDPPAVWKTPSLFISSKGSNFL